MSRIELTKLLMKIHTEVLSVIIGLDELEMIYNAKNKQNE